MSEVPLEDARGACPQNVGINTQLISDEVQGYLAHKKTPIPLGSPRTLGIGLLKGPTGRRFLMNEVPLYMQSGAAFQRTSRNMKVATRTERGVSHQKPIYRRARKRTPLRPYRRPMSRVLGGS